ncbi:MAG: iron chelate uptake ABC transporter family permease subunit [Acidiferrobacterales bacterium]
MDDFLIRAVFGGVGVALAAGPLGCFLVWRRMAFFGAALSHSALLGVALGFLLGINLTLGIALFCLLLATLLLLLERQRFLASDTLLGILAHGTLAAGLVTIAFMENLRIDLMAYLFGDVLAVDIEDLYLIYGLAIVTAVALFFVWRPLLSITVEEDIAAVEGVPVTRVRLVFVLLIATLVAVGMKVVGMLLIISLLIIPAAAARRLSKTPEQMAVIAVVMGALSVVLGLFGSLQWDIPSGPAIVAVAVLIFGVIITWPRWRTPQSQ